MNRSLIISFLILYSIGICTSQITTYKQDIIKFRSGNWKSLISDPRTTLLAQDSVYLDYFQIKEKNKVFCTVVPLANQDEIEMPTYSGKIKSFRKYALIHFIWNKKPLTLTAYQSIQNLSSPLYKNYLFIPLKDKTTGLSTYEGGRYIDVHSDQIQNNRLLLDLNQVYNPWCAYSDGYNCPIPPKENTLAVKLKAGEKKFKKSH